MSGGLYQYRATAECSACGKTADVGPFKTLTDAVGQGVLEGWLLAFGGAPLQWTVADPFGWRPTLCDECMGRPIREVFEAVKERSAAAT